MRSIGIDIGSTATKVAVLNNNELELTLLAPTGVSSIEAAQKAAEELKAHCIDVADEKVVATGYGRIAVPYAQKAVTEITCHAKGAWWLFGRNGVVIDVGGQDTKVLELRNGMLKKFLMNDKCSAGTGKFLEVMANRMNVTQQQLSDLAAKGEKITISPACAPSLRSPRSSRSSAAASRWKTLPRASSSPSWARSSRSPRRSRGTSASSPAACATTPTSSVASPTASASR